MVILCEPPPLSPSSVQATLVCHGLEGSCDPELYAWEWDGWGGNEQPMQRSGGTVGEMINGIDQPVNPGVYILRCLHSPIATVLNWACSKQPP